MPPLCRPGPGRTLVPMKVLILGFEVWEAGRLGYALVRLGHLPVYAVDAGKAIDWMERDSEIVAAIADGRVPNFEWRRFCEWNQARAARSRAYVILLESPREDSSHEDWAADCGVDDFLTRLDDPRELKRRLRLAGRAPNQAAPAGAGA